MSRFLNGIHDPGGEHLFGDKPGWITFTTAITEQTGLDASSWVSRGYTAIGRLNYGYGTTGTIPPRGSWTQNAPLYGRFVAQSQGCNIWIIGNEPNHAQERPDNAPITKEDYASFFRMARTEIKRARPDALVLVAAMAPWNNQTGDWLEYLRYLAENLTCDGFAIHAYTHGTNPSLVFSDEKVQGWHWHFRVYQDQLAVIPATKRYLPVWITEADQDDAWADVNSGWVQNAYKEIDDWNKKEGTQKIKGMTLYRWPRHDRWFIEGKNGLQDDIRAAFAKGYPSPQAVAQPQPPTGGEPPVTEWTIEWDDALTRRGVEIKRPQNLVNGQLYWDVSKGDWLNVQESQGRHHIYFNAYSQQGVRVLGTKFLVKWPGDEHTVVADKAEQYSGNFPMSKSLNEFSIQVQESIPSAVVTGIGMGMDGNSGEHTSTVVEFRVRRHALEAPPPDPKPPVVGALGKLILPVARATRTQRWGENPQIYNAKFGIPYHNGVDLASALGTPVVAVADGKVMFTGSDPSYGNYVRIFHHAFGFHSFMAHMLDIAVAPGQWVKQGHVIGRLGSTGNSTGPHVHFEIRLGSETSYTEGTFGHTNGRVDPETCYHFFED